MIIASVDELTVRSFQVGNFRATLSGHGDPSARPPITKRTVQCAMPYIAVRSCEDFPQAE